MLAPALYGHQPPPSLAQVGKWQSGSVCLHMMQVIYIWKLHTIVFIYNNCCMPSHNSCSILQFCLWDDSWNILQPQRSCNSNCSFSITNSLKLVHHLRISKVKYYNECQEVTGDSEIGRRHSSYTQYISTKLMLIFLVSSKYDPIFAFNSITTFSISFRMADLPSMVNLLSMVYSKSLNSMYSMILFAMFVLPMKVVRTNT